MDRKSARACAAPQLLEELKVLWKKQFPTIDE